MSTVKKVGMFAAKTHLSALVDEVRNGAEIEITKRGKTVARLVPPAAPFDRDKAKEAIEQMRELRKDLAAGQKPD